MRVCLCAPVDRNGRKLVISELWQQCGTDLRIDAGQLADLNERGDAGPGFHSLVVAGRIGRLPMECAQQSVAETISQPAFQINGRKKFLTFPVVS